MRKHHEKNIRIYLLGYYGGDTDSRDYAGTGHKNRLPLSNLNLLREILMDPYNKNAAVNGSLRRDSFNSRLTGAIAGLVSLGSSSKPVRSSPDLDAAPSDPYLTPALALTRAAAGYQ